MALLSVYQFELLQVYQTYKQKLGEQEIGIKFPKHHP